MKTHHVTRAGLVAAGLMAAVIFFMLGAVIRLLVGPVLLGPFSGTLSNALAEALPGVSVKYDEAAVEWSREQGRVGLIVLGARVFDADGRIIAQAPKAAIDLSARSIFSGHPEVKRITLIGVQLTLVRTRDGGIRLGVGKDAGEHDFLTNISDAITATSSRTSSLQAFAVHNARIAFLDEVTGLFVIAPRADMTIKTLGPSIAASVDADAEISGRPARVKANLLLPPSKGPVNGDLSITGLDVGALGANSKMFALLKGIALAVDMSASFAIDHGAHLSSADFGFDAHGTIGIPGLVQGPIHVKSIRVVGRYDGNSGRLLVDDATLTSDRALLHFVGNSSFEYDPDRTLTALHFETIGDGIQLNVPGTFEKPIAFRRLAARGSYLPAARALVVDHVGLEGGAFATDASGKIGLADNQSPAIDLKGSIGAMQVPDLLRYWPLIAGSGARGWISRNMSSGNVGPIAFETHIPAGALGQRALPDGALHVVVPVTNAEVNYLTGLTHLTQVDGNSVLTGNSYTADVSSAHIGSLAVSNAHISIPDLGVPGSPGTITAHIDGTMPNILALIDMKPLNYPTRFGVNAADTGGNASLDLSVHLPLIKDLSVDQVAVSVKAAVTDFDIALGTRGRLSKGTVSFDVNNDRLLADGTAQLAGSSMALDWKEDFKSQGAASTVITAKGTLDDAAREALKLHTGEFIKGPVAMNATLTGRHGHLAKADVALDLSAANVAFVLVGIEKPQGIAANGQVVALFGQEGTVASEEIHFDGPGGALNAQMSFAKDGSLKTFDMPSVKYGPADDFSFHLSRTPASTEVVIRGRSLDGSAFAHEGTGGSGNGGTSGTGGASGSDDSFFEGPFHVSAKLDRLVLREGVSVAPLSLDVAGNGPRLTAMTLSGNLARGATVAGSVVQSGSARRASFVTDDAGQLARGLFGLTGMKGGKLDIAANFPTSGVDPPSKESSAPDFQGTLALKDATLTNQPFLARMFAMASFAGIGNLLQGSGLQIDRVDVPFSSRNGVISVHDAAASGPTIGMTADGYVDRPGNVVALKGSLIPVVGVDFNKFLGAIPVVGNILVSKKGEGIFGVTYSMKGNADQPRVTVNPLAMLTPGIFRRLFQGRIPNAAQAPTNANASVAHAPPPALAPSANASSAGAIRPIPAAPPPPKK